MVACPVIESRFVPQRSEHSIYNIQTDQAAIGAFGGMVERPDLRGLLYSDLQTQSGFHEYGRLGSGRTGCYRGAYLKGVGRTPLAMNWWRFGDRFHATGHLSASGGARELVVSRYFAAKGKEQLIVPCEGLLVAELEPELREARSWRRWKNEECLPCDLALQTISVKRSNFARFSNTTWHLNHLNVATDEHDFINFFMLLMNGLLPTEEIDPGTLVPSMVAKTLAAVIDKTIVNYREYFRLGINWLMPYNNFTMDGRFCDLDVPLFSGPGYIGALPSRETWNQKARKVRAPDHLDFGSIFGFNVIAYLHQMRIVVRSLVGGFEWLANADFHYSEVETGFMRGFVQALGEALPPEHLLWSGEACATMLEGWFDEDCEIASSHRDEIHALIRHAISLRLDHETMEGMNFPIEKVDLRCSRAGASPTLTESFYAVSGCKVRPDRLEEVQLLHDLLSKLDTVTDRDQFLAQTIAATAEIDRHCSA